MRTFTDFDEAKAAGDLSGEPFQVCGTYNGEQPVYFLQAADVPDDVIRDAAFEVKNGRSPSQYERWLLEAAKQEVAT